MPSSAQRWPMRSRPHEGVLALGGGAVLDESSAALVREHQVVFLKVGLADAASRVGLGTSRPMLLGNVRSRIKNLIDERTPVYESVASTVIDTNGRSAEDVAEAVIAWLEEQQ